MESMTYLYLCTKAPKPYRPNFGTVRGPIITTASSQPGQRVVLPSR